MKIRIRHAAGAALLIAGLTVQAAYAAGDATGGPEIHRIADGIGYVSVVHLAHQRDRADNGRLLMVFEQKGMRGIPLYESRDGGAHWKLLERVTDQEHPGQARWQFRWQPHITELRRSSGDLPAGTLLLSGNAGGNGPDGHIRQEDLQLYVSTDGGAHWRYRSSIVTGGGNPSDKDNKGVWEPNLHVLDDGRLVAYYSSEQHKAEGYNQVLAHKVSDDGGKHWGKEVLDVAIPGGVQRPGMAIVTRLPDRRYAMTYENIDGPNNGQVHIKFSRDGLDWGDPSWPGEPVATASGAWPAACPVVRWFPVGGPQGVLVVSAERAGGGGDEDGHALYWNNAMGRGPWWEVPAPVAKRTGNIHAGWTQVLLRRKDGTFLHVTSSSSPDAPADAASNRIVSAVAPLDFNRYEAEDAARSHAVAIGDEHASNGRRTRVAAAPEGRLRFRVHVDAAGERTIRVRFSDVGLTGVPRIVVNGAAQPPVTVAPERDGWRIATLRVPLMTGFNTIDVRGGAHVIDVDYLQLDTAH